MPHEAQNPALPLPFADLGAKGFESFVAAFLATRPTWESLATRPDDTAPGGHRTLVVPHRIIDSAPYAGTSGLKQDGIDLVATTDSGARWAFQCKHVDSFGPAKATTAMDKAEAEFPAAARYFLLLSREPSAATIKCVAARPNWELWGAERLSLRFFNDVPRERQPEVLRQVFGDAAARIIDTLYPLGGDLLQTPAAFFALWLREDRIFHHRSDLVARADDLARLHAFVSSPTESVCILPAPGGRGKSRLLRAFADEFAARHPARKLWFINPSAAPDARPDILRTAAPGEIVIVQDDAHRTETVRPDLLAHLARSASAGTFGKIILAARPQAVASLTSLALRAGFDGAAIVTLPALPKLKRRELEALARARLDPPHRHHAAFLAARAGDCPLIVTVGAELINRGRLAPDHLLTSADFYREVFSRFEEDEFARLSGDPAALREVLASIALLAPWDERHSGLDELAAFLGRPAGALRDLVASLRAAGLLVASTQGLRPAPDLYADFLAFRACYEIDGRLPPFARRIQQTYALTAGPALLRNLSEADWQAAQNHTAAESLLEPFWQRLLDGFKAATFWDRSQIVKRWAAFGVYQPKRSLILARLTLDLADAPPPSTEEYAYGSSLHTHAQVMSELPALLEPIAIYQDEHRDEALGLLWELRARWQPATGDAHHSPLNVIARVASFKKRHPISAPITVLAWLERLLKSPEGRPLLEQRDSILATMLKPVFGRRVDASYSEGRTFHFASFVVSEKQTRPLRDHALRILREIVIPHSEIAALNILTVLEDATSADQPSMGDEPFTPEQLRLWMPERLKALDLVALVLERHPTARTQFRVRRLLARRLRRTKQTRFEKAVARLLKTIPDSAALRWHRLMCSSAEEFLDHDDAARDFNTRYQEAKQRWAEFTQTVVGEFLTAHPTTAQIVEALDSRLREHRLNGETPLSHTLFNQLTATLPADTCREIVREIFLRPETELDSHWPTFIAGKLRYPDAELLAWSLAILDGENADRLRALLSLLKWESAGPIPEPLLEKLRVWTQSAREAQASLIISHLEWMDSDPHPTTQTFLENLDLASLSPDQLDAFVESLGRSTSYGGATLPAALVSRLFAALAQTDELDRRKSGALIRHLAEHHPRATYELFHRRIERIPATRENSTSYQALPWGVRWLMPKLALEPDFEALARDLLSRVKSAPADQRMDWAMLFRWSVLETSDLGLRLIQEWLPAVNDDESLRRLLMCLQSDGSRLIFQHPEFTRSLLRAARRIAPADLDYWTYKIAAISGPTMRGYTNGEPDPEYRYFGEAAVQALSRHADDPELRAFYAGIVERERQDAARHKADAAASDAMLDEA